MATNKKERALHIGKEMLSLFPSDRAFLHYENDWQLLFAVILSAQATDTSVNEATAVLFKKYPRLEDYTEENRGGILSCIKKIGLGKSKCSYLIASAKILLEEYDGKVPLDREKLMKLPGCGYKTSGVVLAELYHYPYIPVDTHVYRVTHRLGLVSDKLSPEETEVALEKLYQGDLMCISLHRAFILFGRNVCLARNPKCQQCPFKEGCRYLKGLTK